MKMETKESELEGKISNISREFFQLYCEDNEVLKESMDDILEIARGTDNDKTALEARKFLVDQIIGKSKQSTDIKGEVNIPSLIVGNIKEE